MASTLSLFQAVTPARRGGPTNGSAGGPRGSRAPLCARSLLAFAQPKSKGKNDGTGEKPQQTGQPADVDADVPSCRAVADEVRLRLRARASSHVTRSRWNNRSVKSVVREQTKPNGPPAVIGAASTVHHAPAPGAQKHHSQGPSVPFNRHNGDDANAIWRLVVSRLAGSATDRRRVDDQRRLAAVAWDRVKDAPQTAASRAIREALCDAETRADALASGAAADRYKARVAPILAELNALLRVPVRADPLTLEAHAPHAGRLRYLTELLHRLSRTAYPALGDDQGRCAPLSDTQQAATHRAGRQPAADGADAPVLAPPARSGPSNPSATCPSCGHLTSGQCGVCGDKADAPAVRHGAALAGGRGYNEAARLAGAHHYVYLRHAHFRNSIVAYQGLQRKVISKQLLSDIEEKLLQKGLLDVTRKNPKERFRNVTRGAVTSALRQLSCPRAYRDVNLICSVLCGMPCPDVAHLEPALMMRFDQVQQTLSQLAAEPGGLPQGTATAAKSGLNSQYLLYHFLRLEGIETKPSDFDMLRNVEQVLLYDNLFRQVCARLDWPFRATY